MKLRTFWPQEGGREPEARALRSATVYCRYVIIVHMRKNQELQLQSEFTSLILVDSITTEKVLEFSPTQRWNHKTYKYNQSIYITST